MIGQITRRKDTGDRGLCGARLHFHIAAVVHLQLVFDQLGCRRVADGDEETFTRDLSHFAGFHMARPDPFNPTGIAAADDLVDGVIPENLNLRVFEQTLLHDLLSPQAVAAVDQRDLGGEFGQEQRLLHSRIAAAHNHNLCAAIKEAVTGGAS